MSKNRKYDDLGGKFEIGSKFGIWYLLYQFVISLNEIKRTGYNSARRILNVFVYYIKYRVKNFVRNKYELKLYVFDRSSSSVQWRKNQGQCAPLYTNKNRYCANNLDGAHSSTTSNKNGLRKSIRHIYLWKYYREVDGIGLKC